MLVTGGPWGITGQVPIDSMIYNLIPPLTPDYAISNKNYTIDLTAMITI